MAKKNPIDIIVHENNCTGCLICQLTCSLFHSKKFNLSEAHIQVLNGHSLNPKISFLDSCLRCGQCAQHCLYGALELKEVEE